MTLPTRERIEKHPVALIIQAFAVSDGAIVSSEFEWFNTVEAAEEYRDVDLMPYLNTEVGKENHDSFYVVTVVKNTTMNPLTDEIDVIETRFTAPAGAEEWAANEVDSIKADPEGRLLVKSTPRKAPAKKASAKKMAVKGRKASPAAAVVQKGPVPAGSEPKARVKGLKERIAGKKAVAVQGGAVVEDEAVIHRPDAADGIVLPSKEHAAVQDAAQVEAPVTAFTVGGLRRYRTKSGRRVYARK